MGAAEAPRANPWWVLAGACTGLFVLMLDSTVVVLALPAIHRDLDASLDGLQWVQNAYLLTLAATVVSAGRLGDILGRRVVFISGMVAFALGSLLSGLADDESVLVVGRVIQGLGGSALLALSLALTTHAFPAERVPRALGIWAAVSAIALALGPLVGGVLIEAAGWRWGSSSSTSRWRLPESRSCSLAVRSRATRRHRGSTERECWCSRSG